MNLLQGALRLTLGERLPTTSGSMRVDALDAPVTIRRDHYGVPHIDARTDADAWYALGFCQGQDRAFQIEILRRIVHGTLAELVGAEGVPLDRLSRRIGFRRSAQEQYAVLEEDIRLILEAFARGVTDGATRGLEAAPHEFALLLREPAPYAPQDVVGLLKYMSLVLSPWSVKLVRLAVLLHDGPQAVQALASAYPGWHPVTQPVGAQAGEAAARLAEDVARLTGAVSTWAASNNWALAPTRTATGRPILANDPHLSPMVPEPWYLTHVRTPEWQIAGASLIGAPGIAVGHNEVAAWGVTAGLIDDVDLYLERVGPDRRSVQEGDAFVPCRVRQEFIQVRGGPPIEEKVLITPRGPIIGPALEGEFDAISMSATWLPARPVRGFLKLHRARTFEEFHEAFDGWTLGSYNLVFADTAGNIGWQLTGETPQRSERWSTLPAPGWDPRLNALAEPVPFEQMPHLANPESGYIATANNKPVQDADGPYLGDNWLDGYRLMRIVEMLGERDDWRVDDMLRLQLDQLSIPWREMREAVLGAPAGTKDQRLGHDLLAAWDGVLSPDSPAAAVYEFLVSELTTRIEQAAAPRCASATAGRVVDPLAGGGWFDHRATSRLVDALRRQPRGWFERPWPEEVADALGAAVARLRREHGPRPEGWRWGEVRQLTFVHPLGAREPFGSLFNLGPFPCGGDTETVNQAKVWHEEPAGNPYAVAGLRMALDVGNWDDNRFVLAGGQSGNPFSPHYDDQLRLWLEGQAMVMPWSEAAVREATEATLVLVPGEGGG